MISTAEYGLDNNISRMWLASYAAKLLTMVSTGVDMGLLEPGAGMTLVAGEAILIDSASNQERKDYKVSELAARFREIYCNAHGIDTNFPASCGEMIAWEAVSRWLAYSVQAPSESDAAEAIDSIYPKARQEFLAHDSDSRVTTHPANPGHGSAAKEASRTPAQLLRDEQLALERAESGYGEPVPSSDSGSAAGPPAFDNFPEFSGEDEDDTDA